MSEPLVKGTVEWEGRRITIEGPADFVSAELDRFRGGATEASGQKSSNANSNRPMTEAAYIALKKPKDHYEKIAVLAAKLRDSGKEEFNDEDMRRAYLRAGIKPPKVMPQALVDTKRHRDYIEPTATKGIYRLTNHGSDFVQFDLPRSEGDKE